MPEAEYRLDWVTETLAVGSAPLSYEQLDRIREQGIDAIVNLCAEYCDLHEIEKDHGFEVYYLPIVDECTPDWDALECAMQWMDGVLKENKRILLHCRLGMGRTGTLLYAYLWSRGLHGDVNESVLERIRARPCNFEQWRLVKRCQAGACGWPEKRSVRTRLTGAWERLASRIRKWL